MNPLNEKANTLARCGSFYYRTLVDESKADAEFVSHLPGLVRVASLGNKIAAAVQGECYYQDYHKLIKFTDSDIDWNGTKAALQARVAGGKGAITTKLEQLSVSAARILGDTDWELLPEDLPEGLKAITSIKMQVLNTSPVITPVYLQVFNIISQEGQADVVSCIATSVEAVELNAGKLAEWNFNTLAINADVVSEANKILFQFATTSDAAWQSATAVPSSQTVGVGAYVPSVQFWRLAAPEQSLATFNRPAQLTIKDHFFAGTDTWEYLAKEGTPQPIAVPGEGQNITLPETQELIWDLHISKDIMVTSIRKQDGTVLYANQDFATQFGKLTFLQNPIALFPNMQFIAQSYTGRMPNLYNYLVRADEVYGPIDRMMHYTRGAQSIKSLYYASAQAAGLAVVSEDCVVVASSPLLDGLAYITTKGRYDAPYPHTPIALGTKLSKDYVIGGKQLYRLIGPYDPMPSNVAGIELGTALPVPGLVAPNAEIEITDELGNYRPKYAGTTAAVTAYHKYLESGSYPVQEPNKKENGIQHFRYTACANRCVVACINESYMTSQMKLRLMTYLRRELPIGSVLTTANLPVSIREEADPNEVPASFIAAEFLTAENAFIELPLACNTKTSTLFIETQSTALQPTTLLHQEGNFNSGNSIGMGQWNTGAYMVNCGAGGAAVSPILTPGEYYTCWLEITPQMYSFGSSAGGEREAENISKPKISSYYLFTRGIEYLGTGWYTRKKWWRASVDGEMLFDLLPCITPQGKPCMYNKVDKTIYGNSYQSGVLIVGMTLAQSHKLANLPYGGGELKISLPSNYTEDEGFAKARRAAESKGWVIEIQIHEAEASEASTFSLRRIWVKRSQHEYGTYVAQDGTRWNVEWCVDIIGADPQERGYEMYRSVDAAVDYWGLSLWIDPEAETELQIEE